MGIIYMANENLSSPKDKIKFKVSVYFINR
jgi:hypothetical protein